MVADQLISINKILLIIIITSDDLNHRKRYIALLPLHYQARDKRLALKSLTKCFTDF